MTTWIKEALQWMLDYRDEILLAVLVLLFILMLILLRAVRKNMRLQTEQKGKLEQMIRLWGDAFQTENRKSIAEGKLDMHTEKQMKKRPEQEVESSEQDMELSERQQKQKEEELFGKVLQEYFP